MSLLLTMTNNYLDGNFSVLKLWNWIILKTTSITFGTNK